MPYDVLIPVIDCRALASVFNDKKGAIVWCHLRVPVSKPHSSDHHKVGSTDYENGMTLLDIGR